MHKDRVAILVGSKGRGSNLGALIAASTESDYPAQITLVVSPVSESAAVDRAKAAGIPVAVCSPKSPGYAEELLAFLDKDAVDWICLAGLMTKLPESVVDAYSGRILNIHPALLPKFGGKGMYGHHVHEAVIAAKEPVTGCTVHVVTAEYDEGQIVLQASCPVSSDDTAETIALKVLELEHQMYPAALRKVVERGV